MNARIENGNLIITIPTNPAPVPSASAKTLIVATTHGAITTSAMVNGKPLTINLNAYIRP